MALTTEQSLLLTNLIYMEPGDVNSPLQRADSFEGQTIADWINSIDVSRLEDGKSYGSYMTGKDWKNIIQAVKEDDTLMQMSIADTHTDTTGDGGGGRSAVFISEETGDAVVTFKGTESSREWADNFEGGNVTDTAHQQNALEWYQDVYDEYGLDQYEVTVTGHSKGGNKAKYITILDDTVDHCVSFDGQGFSDKFMEKYADEIAVRQDKVENHNVDYDYVNFLLNDVGESTYYEGQDYGEGGFLENHCPNTFLNFEDDGSYSLTVNPDGQSEEIQALDEFLNSLLRSMPDEDRSDLLEMVNAIMNEAFAFDENTSGTDIINTFLDMAADPQYADALSYLVAYTVEYEQANPELVEQINNVLSEFGMGEFTEYVNMVDAVLNFEQEISFGILGSITVDFDFLYDLVNGAADIASVIVPDFLWDMLLNWVEDSYGISLSKEELMNLIKLVGKVNANMDSIEIDENGKDIQIVSAATSSQGAHCIIKVNVPFLQHAVSEFEDALAELKQLTSNVESEASAISFTSLSSIVIQRKLRKIALQLGQAGVKFQNTTAALTEINQLYRQTENNNWNAIG